jgi:hypothetical protein
LKDNGDLLAKRSFSATVFLFDPCLPKPRKRIASQNHRSLVTTSIDDGFRSDLGPVRLPGQYLSKYYGRGDLPIDSVKTSLPGLGQRGGFLWYWRISYWSVYFWNNPLPLAAELANFEATLCLKELISSDDVSLNSQAVPRLRFLSLVTHLLTLET